MNIELNLLIDIDLNANVLDPDRCEKAALFFTRRETKCILSGRRDATTCNPTEIIEPKHMYHFEVQARDLCKLRIDRFTSRGSKKRLTTFNCELVL